jgi:hypothetical protein
VLHVRIAAHWHETRMLLISAMLGGGYCQLEWSQARLSGGYCQWSQDRRTLPSAPRLGGWRRWPRHGGTPAGLIMTPIRRKLSSPDLTCVPALRAIDLAAKAAVSCIC